MAFEEFQKRAEPARRQDGTPSPSMQFVLWLPMLAAIVVAAAGGTRLLMEFFPLWLSILIVVPAIVLFFVIFTMSVKDYMDIVVMSVIIIILVLLLVPAELKKIHKSKAAPRQPAPAQMQDRK